MLQCDLCAVGAGVGQISRYRKGRDAGDGARYISQYRYYLKRLTEHLERIGLRLVNIEGQQYDTGMAATALNIADFGPDDSLVVDQMVEPIIMSKEGLVRTGTVILKKAEL